MTMNPPALARSVLEAAGIGLAAAGISLGVNCLRPIGLPLVAESAYETLVPCPEPGGSVEAMDGSDPRIRSARSFLIDARGSEDFAAAHVEGAVNAPYDWLDPLPDDVLDGLARKIAASRASRVVAFGDGGRPDSGEYLGRELSARGIRNVFYVRGGAPALLERGPP
jgi:hypothetical protein